MVSNKAPQSQLCILVDKISIQTDISWPTAGPREVEVRASKAEPVAIAHTNGRSSGSLDLPAA